MAFIQIVDDLEPFAWTPDLEDGKPSDTTIMLQMLTDDEAARLRKKHNHILWKNGQRVDEFDGQAFQNDVVDKAIVSWSGLKNARTQQDIPCTREAKIKLPDRLKLDIARMCVAKDAGKAFGDEVAAGKKS